MTAGTPGESDIAAVEDQARAGCYAIVGQFFYGPPDPNLLAEICAAGAAADEAESAGTMAGAWHRLQDACRNAFPAVVKQEYEKLFVGVGKALVTPYTSRYANALAPDKHLVQLREQLDAWGLVRRDKVFETEDHISGICDVMRYLIQSGAPIEEQQRFFNDYVYAGAIPLLDAVDGAGDAGFYRSVADYARTFLELEREALEMPA